MPDEPKSPQPWWRRKWILGGLAAAGTALVTGAVGDVYPDIKEWITGAAKTPIRISVREDSHGGSDGFELAARSFVGLEGKLRAGPDCESLFPVAKHAGAVDVHRSIEDLLLEGRTHRTVTITDLRAKIIKREPPLAGASITCLGAAELGAIGIAFQLDEPHPVARKRTPSGTGGPYFGKGNVVTLKQGELQPFQVVALLDHGFVEWELEADAIVAGEHRTITIDNHGVPFRLTSAAPRYSRYFEWRWADPPAHLYVSTAPKTQ